MSIQAQSSTWQMRIGNQEFQAIRDLVYDRFGINLTEQKRGLVVGRLQKVLRQRGMTCFGEYYRQLQSDPSGSMISELIDRISTNHTFFFREPDHFSFLRETVLPQLRQSNVREKDMRLWCAAAATGEEPYTLAMVLMDFFSDQYVAWQAGLLATDISDRALSTAKRACYSSERVQHMPPLFKQRFLQKKGADEWEVIDKVRREVVYRRFNLMNTTFPFKRPFDIIFCRNVMIYFDTPTRQALVQRLCSVLRPGGWLFIGHSETIGRSITTLQSIRPAVYRKVD
jgi:chemotaxis protein methyltransferase CheR